MARAPWIVTREMFLSVEEVDHLLMHVRAESERATGRRRVSACLDCLIVEGLLFSGLRNSEFCKLRVADTIIGTGESVFVVRDKRGRDRTVFVPAAVSLLAAVYFDHTRPACLPDTVDPDDRSQPLVFHERRRPYERTGLYRRVVRILTGAGLGSRASVQLLRHTCGYLAYLRTGGNLLFVQRQLGHAHPMVTSIYAEFVEESYQAMAERVFGTPAVAQPLAGPVEPARPQWEHEHEDR